MEPLPPDLTRLGRELTAAIDKSLHVQRRRRIMRRTAAIGGTGALIFTSMTPALLGPGLRTARWASSADDRLVCEGTRSRAERGAPACFTAIPLEAWLPERLTD